MSLVWDLWGFFLHFLSTCDPISSVDDRFCHCVSMLPWTVEAQQEAEAKLIQARAQRESASILAEASKAGQKISDIVDLWDVAVSSAKKTEHRFERPILFSMMMECKLHIHCRLVSGLPGLGHGKRRSCSSTSMVRSSKCQFCWFFVALGLDNSFPWYI